MHVIGNTSRRDLTCAKPVRMLACPVPQAACHRRKNVDAARFRNRPAGACWHRPINRHEQSELRAVGIDPAERGGWRVRSEKLPNGRIRRVILRVMTPVIEFVESA